MLDFKDYVKIVQRSKQIFVTKRIYIILNKFCNNNLTREQKLSEKFNDEILDALKILNSHGYQHADPHFGNVVDCGESSIPQYKLIDFGNMRITWKGKGSVSDISKFQNTKRTLENEIYWENRDKQNQADKAKAAAKAAEEAAAEAAAKAAEEAAKKRAADEIAAKKVELQRKFEIIQKYYPQLRKRFRFMITHYISEYLHSVCPKAVVASSSYKFPEKGLNYRVPNGYPTATFKFESKQDFDECKKQLPHLKLLEGSLEATYSSSAIQLLYGNAANYDTEFRRKIQDIESHISEVSEFLSSHITEVNRTGDAYEDSLNKHFTTLRDIFKFEDQGGGQTKYKLKRRTRRKTRTKSKFKSNSKRGTIIKSKSKSKSKNKRRTRRKSKSKNKRRTIKK
jgi:hypothetical protein